MLMMWKDPSLSATGSQLPIAAIVFLKSKQGVKEKLWVWDGLKFLKVRVCTTTIGTQGRFLGNRSGQLVLCYLKWYGQRACSELNLVESQVGIMGEKKRAQSTMRYFVRVECAISFQVTRVALVPAHLSDCRVAQVKAKSVGNRLRKHWSQKKTYLPYLDETRLALNGGNGEVAMIAARLSGRLIRVGDGHPKAHAYRNQWRFFF